MTKKLPSLKTRDLFQDMPFSQEVTQCRAYYVEKILRTGCRDMGTKHQKCPQNGGFPPFMTRKRIISKNQTLSQLYPCSALTSCKELENTNGQSLRYSQTGVTDHRRTTG